MDNVKVPELKLNYELLATSIAEMTYGSIDTGKTYYCIEEVKKALNKLDVDELGLISLKYGEEDQIDPDKIGEKLGISEKKARQIEAKALRKMGVGLNLQAS